MQPLVAQLLARSVMLPQERLMQFGLDLRNLSEALFIGANLFGLWLLVSLLCSSRR